MKKLFLLIPLLLTLTGCYNYRELNDLAIVSGVSISKEKDTYNIVVEVVNPKKEQDTSSSKEPDYVIYEGKGKSMQEAFRNIVKESPKKLYGAQIDVLIIDEETAKKGIDDIVDFFARDPEVRSEFYVVISANNDTLKIIPPLTNISSQKIINSLVSTNTYIGTSSLVTYHQLLNDFLNPNIEIALPSLKIVGNTNIGQTNENLSQAEPETNVLISNMAIFKNGKLLGYLTEEESLGYNLITNNSQTTLIKNNYKNNQFIINEIIDSSTKINPDIKNKKITISVEGTASISESNYNINLENNKEIKKIQKDLNTNIENLIKTTIENTNAKYNSDIYGFKDLFYKKNPKEHKKLIKKFGDNFLNNIEIKVKSNIKIIEKGNLNGGIYREQK